MKPGRTAVRALAGAALAAGVAAPLVRHRLRLRAPQVLPTAALAPVALCVLFPRSRARDAGTLVLQMWAYLAGYEMPNDDPEALERRVRVGYPVRIDRMIGLGTTPTLRLQRAFGRPGRFAALEKVLVWSHWVWFAVPHGTALWLLLRRREHFEQGAARIYATFDLGLIGYWAVPTAPPWYAARAGLMADGRTPELRRMMVEYGEEFWGERWTRLYGVLGGNPLAAMPSLHFATSVQAARVLSETGRVAGALGWAYTGTLGLALVYLGEHYVVDLAVGLALAEGVRRAAPAVAPGARELARRAGAGDAGGMSSGAPVQTVNPGDPEDEDDGDEPRFDFTPRKLALFALFVVVSIVALYFLLPKLAGLEDTWHRIEDGSPGWLVLALLFTVGSFAGYVALFQGVFVRAETKARIGWRESYQITMAGLAATRLFAAGGAGGLVLTAWALRRSGMRRRQVADKTLAFLILTYLVYMAALVVCGFGLWWGVFAGDNPFAMTVVPALIALVLLVIGLSMALIPTDFERRLQTTSRRENRLGRWAQRAANIPASWSAGMREALTHVRDRDPAVLGAIGFWACQILVLWAAFRAFGEAPTPAILIMAFFVGMFGNLLPLPGGIGGVDGGMIGAFAAFGVDVSLAVVAVLVYRGFVFWLPTIPGAIAYFQLRKTIDRWRSQPRPVL